MPVFKYKLNVHETIEGVLHATKHGLHNTAFKTKSMEECIIIIGTIILKAHTVNSTVPGQ